MTRYQILLPVFLLIFMLGVVGCRNQPEAALPTDEPLPTTVTAAETVIPPTETAIPPTATAEAAATTEPMATLDATATTEPEPSPTAVEPEAAAPTATPTLPPPDATLEPLEGEPTEIVRAFLNSFMAEEETAQMVRYLDADLRAQVEEGETIAGLLGVSEPYLSFALTLLDDGSRDGEAAVRAALSYAEPVYVRFLLTEHENGSWYISAIEPDEAPTDAGDPGEVVNEFLTALLYDRSGSSSLPYLSQAVQQEVAGGRSVLDLLGVDQVYRTYNYSIVNDGSRTGTAVVEATLDYAGGPVTVTFSLIEEGGAWQISRISSG